MWTESFHAEVWKYVPGIMCKKKRGVRFLFRIHIHGESTWGKAPVLHTLPSKSSGTVCVFQAHVWRSAGLELKRCLHSHRTVPLFQMHGWAKSVALNLFTLEAGTPWKTPHCPLFSWQYQSHSFSARPPKQLHQVRIFFNSYLKARGLLSKSCLPIEQWQPCVPPSQGLQGSLTEEFCTKGRLSGNKWIKKRA